MKILVAYFTASGGGITEDAAKKIAAATGGDLYEITPEAPYSKEDLDWMNPLSRSSVEMKDKNSRPAIKGKFDAAEYGTIFLGFPVWWYTAPTIVNTFLESGNFEGKKIILFATSGSSGFENSLADLKKSAPGADMCEGMVVHGKKRDCVWNKWIKSLGIL